MKCFLKKSKHQFTFNAFELLLHAQLDSFENWGKEQRQDRTVYLSDSQHLHFSEAWTLTSHLSSLSLLRSFVYKMGMTPGTSLDYIIYQIRHLSETPAQARYLMRAGFLSFLLISWDWLVELANWEKKNSSCQWQDLSFSKFIKSLKEVCTSFRIIGYFHGDAWSIYVSVWEGTVYYLSWRLSGEKEDTPASHHSSVHPSGHLTFH